MAYQVNRYNGNFLVSVPDGTIDSTTSIRFVGKNYAGYGQVQNENFLHLMENFAGANQPSKPISGQLWYDTTDRKIKVYDGTRFRTVGGATSSATAPNGLSAGEFWFDNLAQQLYCWTGTEFTLIGPQNPTALGETSVTSYTVKDSSNENRSIARIKAGGTDIAVISKDTFILSSADQVTLGGGFDRIKKGITLIGTKNDQGITSTASSAVIWGTAASAIRIVDPEDDTVYYDVNDLVLKEAPNFPNLVSIGENGFTIGTGSTVQGSFFLEDSTNIVLQNQAAGNIKFNIRISSTETRTLADVTQDSILPGVSSDYNLGAANAKWYQVFADNFIGNLAGNVVGNVTGNLAGTVTGNLIGDVTGNLTGTVTGNLLGNASSATTANRLNNVEASETATSSTIAARNSSGNLVANQFIGIADKADRMRINDSATDTDVNYRSAKTTQTPNTIAARDSSADLTARIFRGSATAVVGADLAEKYLADKEYEVGTVMVVCEHGDHEVEASTWGQRAIGVVSGNPGLMMNQALENGVFIALKGRVPCKVVGSIRKGQRLVAANNGTAVAAVPHSNDVFAVALETNADTDVKIIEVLVL